MHMPPAPRPSKKSSGTRAGHSPPCVGLRKRSRRASLAPGGPIGPVRGLRPQKSVCTAGEAPAALSLTQNTLKLSKKENVKKSQIS